MTISLPPEVKTFIEARVASGKYQSASDVVREGLRLLKERDAEREAALAELRRKIQAGLDELDRGEGIDGERVFRELAERSRKRREERP